MSNIRAVTLRIERVEFTTCGTKAYITGVPENYYTEKLMIIANSQAVSLVHSIQRARLGHNQFPIKPGDKVSLPITQQPVFLFKGHLVCRREKELNWTSTSDWAMSLLEFKILKNSDTATSFLQRQQKKDKSEKERKEALSKKYFEIYGREPQKDFFNPRSAPIIQKRGIQNDLSLLGLDFLPDNVQDIRRAYRSCTKTTHPDCDGNNEAFIQLTEAYNRILQNYA